MTETRQERIARLKAREDRAYFAMQDAFDEVERIHGAAYMKAHTEYILACMEPVRDEDEEASHE